MYPDDLMCFLHLLEQSGRLARIQATVDPYLELAAIVDRVSKGAGGGRAVLFEAVHGASLPVAANLFGAVEQIGWALGTTDLKEVVQRFSADLAVYSDIDSEHALSRICSQTRWQPIIVTHPVCRAADHTARGLELLPPVVGWPGDGGPFLTLAQVFSRHPDGGALNCGLYRIQRHGSHAATIRCRPGSGAARHLAAWHNRGRAMPVAVALGGAPILTWAASAPLPDDVDETAFCGYILGQRLEMSECQNSGLLVPARAEVVIEGVIEPGSMAVEGPFANHTGIYDFAAKAPLMRVLSVHAREQPIYPWTLVGPPPMENIQLAQVTARMMLPLVKMAVPTVRALHMPAEGIFHRAAIITVEAGENRPLEELAKLLRGTLLLRGSRLLIVGTADHEPQDYATTFWRVLNRADWQKGLLIENGWLTVDARRQAGGEAVHCDAGILERILARWSEFQLDKPE